MSDTCRICGVKMTFSLGNDICIHCEWHLEEGYSEEQIKQLIKEAK